ncbi:MAG: hypothetical protein HC915_19045, partial [Anaerolineae bacterium]|nr:hypothetical protein [Anaerolineae bacterium]
RDSDGMDRIAADLIPTLTEWIGAQVRLDYWEEVQQVLRNLIERMQYAIDQLPHELQTLDELGAQLRAALDQATANGPGFPGGTLSTLQWMNEGLRSLPSLGNSTLPRLVAEVFSRWDKRDLLPTSQLQRFPMEILEPTRLMIQPHASFAALHDFALAGQNGNLVQAALARAQENAAPAWLARVVPELHPEVQVPPQLLEYIREAPRPFSLLPRASNPLILQQHIPLMDPDEVLLIRMMHGCAPDMVKVLREEYPRAYARVSAENVPLHIDRRWESVLPDLSHSRLRTEGARLWEDTLRALQTSPAAAQSHLNGLIQMLATALNPQGAAGQTQLWLSPVPDIQLAMIPD